MEKWGSGKWGSGEEKNKDNLNVGKI